MKNRFVSLLLLVIIPFTGYSQADLDYYLPDDIEFDPAIPTPEEVIGHQVGEWHVTHDKLVSYMYAIAEASDRVTIEEYAKSYEDRPLLILTITSPGNHAQIDEIKENQLALTEPDQSGDVDIENQPVVVNIGNSIHGNEPSGSNSSMLTAYYFAAAQGERVEEILDDAVLLLDPSFNPDGLNRFATWVNMHKSITTTTDPADREYNERWPSGRTNHYWFDLNRDWMPVQHPESRGRITKFHEWRPNILTDHHEMGSNSTFFFQPGIPSRTHPLTPQINQDLTGQIAEFHAEALDEIQSLYYSKESFDDFYYGKGSTYPDLFGTIGILFEQASSRGHAQETDHGVLEFPFTIRNQFTTALSTVDAAVALRTDLHEYRRDYYRDVREEASNADAKAFVIGDPYDRGRNYHFADLLSKHNVDMYELSEDIEVNGQEFRQGSAWVIPTDQAEYKFIEAMFETRTEFTDSLFYDVSTWTLPFAFNLPYAELDDGDFDNDLLGNRVENPELPSGEIIGGESNYAYIFSWDEYYAPRTLYRLQDKGVRTKVIQKPTTVETPDGPMEFDYGSIVLALGTQDVDAGEIYSTLQTASEEDGVTIYNVTSGLSVSGVDLGSPSIVTLEKPEIAILVGSGISSYDVGEAWHQFDQRYKIPITMIEKDEFGSADLDRYNTIIMSDGGYGDLSENSISELKEWIRNDGVLILQEGAIEWGINQDLVNLTAKQDSGRFEFSEDLSYADLPSARGAQYIGGTIFNAALDTTHPLGYGYNDEEIYVFRSGTQFYEQPENHFSVPVSLTEDPLASGYISDFNLELIRNTPSIVVDSHGGGRIISFVDNPNFRAFWFGQNKLFANAIFFGRTIYWASTN
ncbi:MAG: M14 family zinc carboxypeptidase [Balneolaceae bacterium]|nr:M14 family zinc carboxypeptidase [Balneolaceae bacterium]